jgi:hypothetical protein
MTRNVITASTQVTAAAIPEIPAGDLQVSWCEDLLGSFA